MRICSLCQQPTGVFADSHVYPLALHHLLANGPVPPFVLHADPPHPNAGVSKNLGGEHAHFVCHECEQRQFGPADNEFMRTYHAVAERTPPISDEETIADLIPGNPALIHRFAIQTLWRGHMSGLPLYRQPYLDHVAERFRRMLLSSTSTIDTGWEVAVVLCDRPGAMLVLPPWRGGSQLEGQMITMVLPRFTFLVASNTRWLPIRSLQKHILRPGREVQVLRVGVLPEFVANHIPELVGKREDRARDFIARHKKPKEL